MQYSRFLIAALVIFGLVLPGSAMGQNSELKGMFEDDGAGGTNVFLKGTGVPSTQPNSVTINGTYTVTITGHGLDNGEYYIEGHISQPISTFPEGQNYVVLINSTSFTGVEFVHGGGEPIHTDIGHLEFSNIPSGGSASLGFTVFNDMDESVSITFQNLPPEISISPASQTIAVGGNQVFTATYTAGTVTGDINGSFGILATPPGDFVFDMSFHAFIEGGGTTPTGPQIDVTPNPIDFGNVENGSSSTGYATISNGGDEQLNVTAISFNTSEYELVSPALPINIPSLGNQQIEVRFSPAVVGNISGIMTVTSNDPNTANFSVGLTGAGVESGGGSGGGGTTTISVTSIAITTAATGTGTEFWVYGTGFSSSNVMSIDIYQDAAIFAQIPVANLQITSTEIMYLYSGSIDTIPSGTYYVIVNTTEGNYTSSTVDWTGTGSGEGGTGTEFQLYGGTFSYVSSGVTKVVIYGDNIPNDLLEVSVDSYNVTNFQVVPADQTESQQMEIQGTINHDISTFSEGNYNITAVSSTHGTVSTPSPVYFNLDQSNMPEIHNGYFSESDSGTGTKATVWVSNIAQDITSMTIGGNAVSGLSYEIGQENSMAVNGTIGQEPTSLPDGDYEVQIVSPSSGTVTKTLAFENYATKPQIHDGHYFPTGNATQTLLMLGQKNIPDDLTSITIGNNTTSTYEFYNDPFGDWEALAVWIDENYNSFSGGTFTITLESSSLGSKSFDNINITEPDYKDVPPFGSIYVWHLGIDPFLGTIRVDVGGNQLTSSTVTSAQVSADPTFSSGTVYDVEIDPDRWGSEVEDGETQTWFEGTLTGATFSSFAAGDYYIKVQTTDGMKLQYGTYEKPSLSSMSQITFEQVGFAHYSSGKTLVAILGENFDALHAYSDAQIVVSDQSLGKAAAQYTVDVFGMDDNEGAEGIFGTVDVGADQFPAGNYYVQASGGGQSATSEALTTTISGVVPTSPTIYQFGRPFFTDDDDPNSTYFTIIGDLFTTVGSIQISQDPTFSTGVYNAAEWDLTIDEEGAIDVIEGNFRASISSLATGAWYFKVTFTSGSSVTSPPLYHGTVPSGGSDTITMTGGNIAASDAGGTEFTVYGSGFTTSNITGLELYYQTTAGTDSLAFSFTATELSISSTQITATSGLTLTSMPEGTYKVVLKTSSQGDLTGQYTLSHGGTGNVITITGGDVVTTSTGTVEFVIEGTGFSSTNISGLEIYFKAAAGDSLAFSFTATDLAIDDTHVKGFYNGALTSLPVGTYYFILKTNTTQGDITSTDFTISHGGSTPVVTVYSFYMSVGSGGSGTLFKIEGSGFSDTDITGLEISTSSDFSTIDHSFTASELTITPTTISAEISTDLNSLTAGEYYARVSATSLSGDYAVVQGPYTHDPTGGVPSTPFSIYSIQMGLDDNQNVRVWISASGFSRGDVSSVQISTDPTFADRTQSITLTVEEINENVTGNNVHLIIGNTGTNVHSFTEGHYYARIELSDGTGTASSDGFYFDPSAYQGPGDIDVYKIYIYDGVNATRFVMTGEGFDALSNADITIDLAGDSLFTGTVYPVSNVAVKPDPNRNDRITGTLSVPASTIVSGEFFIRFTVNGDPHIQRLYYSDPTEQIYINEVQAEESPVPGNTELFVHGDNFNLMTLTGVELSPDSTFTDSVYTATDFSIFSNNELYARVAFDYFDLRIQRYFVRFTTSLGQIVVGFDFEGQEITIDEIELVEGTTAGQTLVKMKGKGFGQIDLAGITVIVSNDGTFATNVYPVTNMTYTVESGVDVITGSIEADYSSLPSGNWYMRVIDTEDQESMVFPFYFGSAAHEGKILDLDVYPGFSGGVDVKIFAENFGLTEIQSVLISSDVTFAATSTVYTLGNINVSEETGGFLMITGSINVAATSIAEGDYYVKIITTSGAEVISLPFTYEVDVTDIPPPVIISFPEVLYSDTTSVTIGWETDKPATSEIEYNTADAFNGNNMQISDTTKVTSHIVRIKDLTPGITYKYRVMSTDENGKMTGAGDYTFATSRTVDNIPPVIAYPQIFNRDTSSITVGWNTNELATSIVEYNTTALWEAGEKLQFEDTTLVKHHKVTLTGLQPGTEYTGRVGSVDKNGNGPSFSPERTFETLANADRKAPVIVSPPYAEVLDTSRAEIIWYTDEASDSKVEFRPLIDTTQVRIKTDSTYVFEHRVMLTGLTPGKTYAAKVYSSDPAGNGPVGSKAFTFRMPTALSTQPPIFILQPEIIDVDTSKVTIYFESNKYASTIIEYNEPDDYEQGTYLTFEDQNFVKRHKADLTGLTPNTEYKFHAMMYDASGLGPTVSQVLTFKTLGSADTDAPVMDGFPIILDKDTSSVVIGWKTNEPATSVIEYAPAADYPDSIVRIEDVDLDDKHIVFIGGLQPNSEYKYRLESTDSKGNTASYPGPFSFMTTEEEDTDPPVFLGYPHVFGIDTNQVTIEWVTNEYASSIVEYNTDDNFDGVEFENATLLSYEDYNMVIVHKVVLTDLESNRTYKYRVGSVDRKNNGPAYSQVLEFRTSGVSDNVPPVILGFPRVNVIDTSNVKIIWATNEASNSIVYYRESGSTNDYFNVQEQDLVIEHDMLLSGLGKGMEFEYYVSSTDENGNGPTVSPIGSFTTLSIEDTEPPNFKMQPQVERVDTSQAMIVFDTDELATTTVEYNEADLYDSGEYLLYEDFNLVLYHDVLLTGLDPETRYKFHVKTVDSKGNGPTVSRTYTFVTSAGADIHPPKFLGFPTVIEADTDYVKVQWLTDEISTSLIEYAILGEYETNSMIIDDAALTTEHTLTLPGLTPNTQYVYIVKSRDNSGNEAVFPKPQFFKTPDVPDNKAPVIEKGPYVSKKDTSWATFEWLTDEQASGTVELSLKDQFSNTASRIAVYEPNLSKFHSITVYGLQPDTEYEYQVSSVDGKNNGPIVSELKSFKTLALADTKPPVIFGFPDARVLDTTSVAIIWKTDEQSDSRVEYAPENDQTTFFSKELQTYSKEHVVPLKDLLPGTVYVFNVYSTDAQGNGPTMKGPYRFKTAETADTSPPSWTVWPTVGNVDTSSFIIVWGSDERCNSGVQVISANAPNDTLGYDDQQLVLDHSVYVGGLEPATTYNVRVYAYDAAGNGPTYSGWFDITTRDQADLDPPRILGIPQIADLDTSSATIKFLTNEPATYEFEYGLASMWPNNTTIVSDPDFNVGHEIILTNLLPDTIYTFSLSLADRAGNTWITSVTKDLTTPDRPDDDPPQIIGLVNVAKIDTAKAAINWFTDERSNTVVNIGESSGYPANAVEYSEQNLVIDHWIHLKGLKSDTEYTFTVSSTDGKGNGPTTSDEYTLKTLAAPDLSPPVMIGQPSERDIDTTFVTIIWGTDEPANSMVRITEFSDTTQVLNIFDGDFVTEHAVYVPGLKPNTKYLYKVSSFDAYKNGPTISRIQTFTTPGSADTDPPAIVGQPVVIGLTHEAATIKFKTNEQSYALINYGVTSDLGTVIGSEQGNTVHNIRLTNLQDSTLYYFRIEGSDNKGNEFTYPPDDKNPLSFKTKVTPAVQDTTPPEIIAGPAELEITSDKMTIAWKTNVFANSRLDYGTDNTLAQTITRDNNPLVLKHIVQLTNLTADTEYFYRLRSVGSNGKEVISDIYTIYTAAEADTFPPVILEGPILSFVQTDNAAIEWRTDKPSSSIIEYGFSSDNLNYILKANEIVGTEDHIMKLQNLLSDTLYFYIVTSTSANGESVTSSVNDFRTPATEDFTPPRIIRGPDPTVIEDKSVTIEWQTDELSTSKLEYGVKVTGTDPDYTETIWVDEDADGVFHHKVVLTGLTPNTAYNFRVSSVDLSPQLNEIISRNKRFKTAAVLDSIAPRLIGGPQVDWTDKTATFEWETDEASDSFVLIKRADSVLTETRYRKFGSLDKVTRHVITVTNLIKGAGYEYMLASRDQSGNLFTWPEEAQDNSLEKTLALRKTAQIPGGGGSFFTNEDPDTQQPIIIEGPTVVGKTTSSITIQWKTDERSDSFIEYGTDTNYGSTKGDATDVTEHQITLTNLDASTLYNFLVKSTDPSDNGPAQSSNSAVSTEAEADETPPQISDGPVAQSITDDQATIVWETDELADTQVEYGLTEELGTVRITTEDETVHNMVLTNLSSNTTYYYQVKSTDIEDNGPTSSSVKSFTTASAPDETPPVISNAAASAITDAAATISYTTDELGDSFVDFGIDSSAVTSKTNTEGDATDVIEHTITLTNLDPNTEYYYRVGSVDKSDNEGLGTILSFQTSESADTEAPGVPTGLSVISGSGEMILSWNPNTEGDLAGYNIYRKSTGDFQLVASLVTDTSYYDNGLTNGTTYEYKVSSADQVVPYNESTAADPVTASPSADLEVDIPVPSSPSEGQRISNENISLTVNNVDLPTGRTAITYEFVIAEESDFFNQVASTVGVDPGDPETTWNSGSDLIHNQTYYWKVRAYDGYFHSDWSSAMSFIADSTVTTSVELVDFYGEDRKGSILLSWETAKEINNAGFRIYRSNTENGEFNVITTGLIDPEKSGEYSFTDSFVEVGRTYFYRLEAVSTDGSAQRFEAIEVRVLAPETFEMHQNYPNPFNPVTTIRFDLPKPGKVVIKIYNILGQEVKTLVNENKPGGFHKIRWNGTDNFGSKVASGMYIYRIVFDKNVKSKKMVLIK